jgi:subtilisin family serine protease
MVRGARPPNRATSFPAGVSHGKRHWLKVRSCHFKSHKGLMLTTSRLLTILVSVTLVGGCAGAVLLSRPARASSPVTTVRASRLLTGHSGPAVSRGGQAAALAHVSKVHRSISQQVVPHLDPRLNLAAGLPVPDAASQPRVPVEKNGDIAVTVQGPAASAAAVAADGRVLGSSHGSVTVAIKPARLRALAAEPGVSQVRRSVRPLPQVTSEAVTSSGAQNYVNATGGNGGSGVKIGIVDAGFGNLSTQIGTGNLGSAGQVVYPSGQNHCIDDTSTDHGTAVAEIVHQMAPNATLYLYCVVDNVTFAAAASQIVNAGDIKIVNSSLGFTAETRGDGTGGTGTTEQAVSDAKAAGVLWIQSAGNSAEDHWAGNLTDADNDGVVDLVSSSANADVTALDPGTAGNVVLSWDRWPTSNLNVSLGVQEYDSADNPIGSTVFADHVNGQDPTLQIDIQNSTSDTHIYQIFISEAASNPTVHYDLYYGGDVYPSYLSGQNPTRAAAGSILQPASSPDAFAVGAADWRSNGLEPFSSRGPTIDGRVKPDLLGFDGTSSNIADVQSNASSHSPPDPALTGFYGTSAASPHVAGAAALVLGANPTMTAADIVTLLEARASPKVSPATNLAGHGLLQLLAPAAGGCPASAPLPSRILIDRPDVSFSVRVNTTCTHYVALAALAGTAGVLDNLFWQDTATTRTTHFYARTNVVGRYTTRLNGGVADQGRVTWTPASTTLKYVTLDYVVSSRKGAAVYINGLLKNYSNTAAGLIHPTGRLMYLQRYLNGAWQNMLSRPVNSAGAMAVGFIQTTVYQYRLVTPEASTAWNGTSASTFR